MVNVQLLTSEGCTPCLRVKRILRELQAELANLAIEEVEYASSQGSKFARENGILYPPAVFLEGKLIAKGKIDAQSLVETIRKESEDYN